MRTRILLKLLRKRNIQPESNSEKNMFYKKKKEII